MFGFSAHFGIGLLLALVFVLLDKKGRYRTLIVGGFAATIPDIDSPGVFLEIIEHRGFAHSVELFLIGSGLALVVILLLIGYDIRSKEETLSDAAFDKSLYFGAFVVGWASHLIFDFGFTKYETQEGLFISLSFVQLEVIENVMGLVVALILGLIIWLEVRDKPKQSEPVGRFNRLEKSK